MKKRLFPSLFAFTLPEVMVAVGMLSILAGGSVSGLIQLNSNASLARLQTSAAALAQTRIDRILGDIPFNPPSAVPASLTPGTRTEGSAASPSIPIYVDPNTGLSVVNGWISTTVTDTKTSWKGQSLKLYQATVTVNFSFRGKSYQISMDTMRCSDS